MQALWKLQSICSGDSSFSSSQIRFAATTPIRGGQVVRLSWLRARSTCTGTKWSFPSSQTAVEGARRSVQGHGVLPLSLLAGGVSRLAPPGPFPCGARFPAAASRTPCAQPAPAFSRTLAVGLGVHLVCRASPPTFPGLWRLSDPTPQFFHGRDQRPS